MTNNTTSNTTSATRARWLPWVGLAARLVLGGVLLVAGALKVGNLGESVNAVRGYVLLPWALTEPVGYALPIIEIVVGALLIAGVFTRWAALVAALLMVAFMIGIGSAWARGISIDCGCFGGGGPIALADALAAYPLELARDAGLFLAGLLLVWRPTTPFALDNRPR